MNKDASMVLMRIELQKEIFLYQLTIVFVFGKTTKNVMLGVVVVYNEGKREGGLCRSGDKTKRAREAQCSVNV